MSIAAVNMSYGEYTTSSGHCDSSYADLAQQVDLLTGAVVAVVAASGNAGELSAWAGKLPSPACIENVISVAAVDKAGTFAPYSNASPVLDLLAPGGEWNATSGDCTGSHQCVLSAIPGSSYGYNDGTSQAGPHVAGAIAGLRNVWPKSEATVASIVQHIKDTGQPVNFSQGGTSFTKPLVKLSPAITTPGTPASATVVRQLCYGNNDISWAAASGSPSHYQLQAADDAAFTYPYLLYSGTATSQSLTTITGTTWLRVRACRGPSCGNWRNGSQTALYYHTCV